jgi:nucleotide-binding universal stress UspA family protein
MKILIGYDGSDCAKEAIGDLQWAGLGDRIEAEVLTIADVFPHLTPECYQGPAAGAPEDPPIIKLARALAAQALAEAKELSGEGAADVRARFPQWEVRANAFGHSPYWGIISRAAQWQPDLVVVGSHGRSAAGRVLLGSVSQKTLAYAGCSVRIGRPRPVRALGPVRLLIGVDGSSGAADAVGAVAARRWPAGSDAILLTAMDAQTSWAVWSMVAERALTSPREDDERGIITAIINQAARRLREAGLSVQTVVREGKAKAELLNEAERSGVDCIFVGARGLSKVERILLGSVSSAVAARAHCSVEVVRRRAASAP